MEKIDVITKFNAINPCNNKSYDEYNAVVFFGDDPALIAGLEEYATECKKLGCNYEHIQNVGLVIDRTKVFQRMVTGGEPTESYFLDRKFIFKATRLSDGRHYDESSAFIFCAKDKAFPAFIDGYAAECDRLGCKSGADQARSLKERVLCFQLSEVKIPDTDGECETARCIYGEGL